MGNEYERVIGKITRFLHATNPATSVRAIKLVLELYGTCWFQYVSVVVVILPNNLSDIMLVHMFNTYIYILIIMILLQVSLSISTRCLKVV